MKTTRLLPLVAFATLTFAGCSSAVNSTLPLPQSSQYTYWRKIPDTNLYEAYVSDHPLTRAEQDHLGVVDPGTKPAPAPEAK